MFPDKSCAALSLGGREEENKRARYMKRERKIVEA